VTAAAAAASVAAASTILYLPGTSPTLRWASTDKRACDAEPSRSPLFRRAVARARTDCLLLEAQEQRARVCVLSSHKCRSAVGGCSGNLVEFPQAQRRYVK
jgi:hypothetical protein